MFAIRTSCLATLLLALVALTGPTVSPVCAAENLRLGQWCFDLEGEVLDTRKSLRLDSLADREMPRARLAWSGLTLRISALTPADDPDFPHSDEGELGHFVWSGILACDQKFDVTIENAGDAELEAVLAAHRNRAGLGVKGPLAVAGRLYVVVEDTDAGGRFTFNLRIRDLTGPHGSYRAVQ